MASGNSSDHPTIDGSDSDIHHHSMIDGSDAFDQNASEMNWREIASSLRSELMMAGVSDRLISKIVAILEWSEREREEQKSVYEESLRSLRGLNERMRELKKNTVTILEAKNRETAELRTRLDEHSAAINEASDLILKLNGRLSEGGGNCYL